MHDSSPFPEFPLLHPLLSTPTAPFREGLVISTIREALAGQGVPHFLDPVGNIVVGVGNRAEYRDLLERKSREPVRIIIAHMDHPGFHGVEWKNDRELAVTWLGGSPTQHLKGARVWLASRDGWAGQGEMKDAKLQPHGKALLSATIRVPGELRESFPRAKDLFGGFAFREPCWREGELIYTKAADDLVGSFAIVSLAIELFGRKAKRRGPLPPFIGLLTRAEEVGFIGAIGHFELGWLKKARRPLLGVSLETSRALPGAEIGKGPVVRLGDRYTVFDAGALRVFSDLAAKLLPDAHQRRVMDGGTCEATAATVYGIPCVGISIPLGNYHNQSFEGGPDSAGPLGPAPEFVHLKDIAGLLALCRGLLRPGLPWSMPWADRRTEFRRSFRKYGPLVRSRP